MNKWIVRIGVTALALAASACSSEATGGSGATSGGEGGKSSTATGLLATGSAGSGAAQTPAQQLYGTAIHNLDFEIDYSSVARRGAREGDPRGGGEAGRPEK